MKRNNNWCCQWLEKENEEGGEGIKQANTKNWNHINDNNNKE